MLVDLIKNYSNYEFVCPQKPGFFYALNMPLDLNKYIPEYLLSFLTGIWEFTTIVKAKTATSKTFVHAFTTKIEGISF